MNYEEMSNNQINKRVAALLGLKESTVSDMMYGSGLVVYPHDNEVNFDPCNNPYHAQSIILQTCMTIELAHPELGGVGTNTIYNPRGTDWQCDYEDNKQWLRAAMICFLKMKESDNG